MSISVQSRPLTIPRLPEPPYVVQKGDTMEGIAAKQLRTFVTTRMSAFRFRELFGVPSQGASAVNQPAWTKKPEALRMWNALVEKHDGSFDKATQDFVKTNTFKKLVLDPWLATPAGYAKVRAVQDALVTKNDIADPNFIRAGDALSLLTAAQLSRLLSR